MSAKRVLFVPDWSVGNPYQFLLASQLEEFGWKVTFCDYPTGVLPLNKLISQQDLPDLIHVHWPNTYIAPVLWARSPWKQAVRRALIACDLLIARIRGCGVIWTLHNLVSHESKDVQVELRALRVIARWSSKIIAHSHSALKAVERAYGLSLENKANIIPMGNFIGHYSEDSSRTAALRADLGLEDAAVVILFFGAIRRYKGIERFLESFKKVRRADLRLVIAGNGMDTSLVDHLRDAAAADARVRLRVGFIPDEDVASYFALANVVALPFERSLTSASTVLAMSEARALLVPNVARVFDLLDEDGALFYENDAELMVALECIDSRRVAEMGRHNLQKAKSFTWRGMAKDTAAVYESARLSPRARK